MTFLGSKTTFFPDNTYNGRRIGDMSKEEKQKLKELLMNKGASEVIFENTATDCRRQA